MSSEWCPLCSQGDEPDKVCLIPYRRARRDKDGNVTAYGPLGFVEVRDEKVADTLRSMMKTYNQAELVILDEEFG